MGLTVWCAGFRLYGCPIEGASGGVVSKTRPEERRGTPVPRLRTCTNTVKCSAHRTDPDRRRQPGHGSDTSAHSPDSKGSIAACVSTSELELMCLEGVLSASPEAPMPSNPPSLAM